MNKIHSDFHSAENAPIYDCGNPFHDFEMPEYRKVNGVTCTHHVYVSRFNTSIFLTGNLLLAAYDEVANYNGQYVISHEMRTDRRIDIGSSFPKEEVVEIILNESTIQAWTLFLDDINAAIVEKKFSYDNTPVISLLIDTVRDKISSIRPKIWNVDLNPRGTHPLNNEYSARDGNTTDDIKKPN